MARPNIGQLIPLFKSGLPPSPYTRPVDWLTLPEVSEGDQKVVGLHAVFPHDSNFVALQVSGAYTVDWGDGVVENYSGGASAYHKFDYNDLGAETECVRGYRQAIVTIIPTPGQKLTSVNFSIKHNQSGLPNGYSTGWLDVKAAGSEINTFRFETFTVVRNAMLEIFEFVGSNKITTNFSYMFYGCYSLQSIPQLDTSSGTNFSYMFRDCYSLQSIPQLDTSSGTNFSYMFYGCYSLQSIPQLDTSSGTNFSYMFRGCYSLQSIPQLDTSSGTNFSYMFYGCYSLQSIPQLNTSSGTNFSYMFYGCYSLQSIPQLNTSSGTNFSYMFGIVAYGSDHCCHSLSAGALSGTSYDISYENCRLSRQALVDIFNGLATVSGATINIMGNWGIEDLTTEDRNIATNKGWIIKE